MPSVLILCCCEEEETENPLGECCIPNPDDPAFDICENLTQADCTAAGGAWWVANRSCDGFGIICDAHNFDTCVSGFPDNITVIITGVVPSPAISCRHRPSNCNDVLFYSENQSTTWHPDGTYVLSKYPAPVGQPTECCYVGEFGPSILETVTPPCIPDRGLFIEECNRNRMSKSGVIVMFLSGTTGAGGRVSGTGKSTMGYTRTIGGNCCPDDGTLEYDYEAFHGSFAMGWRFPWNEQQGRPGTISFALWAAGQAMERTIIVNTTPQEFINRWVGIIGVDDNMCLGASTPAPIGPNAELRLQVFHGP